VSLTQKNVGEIVHNGTCCCVYVRRAWDMCIARCWGTRKKRKEFLGKKGCACEQGGSLYENIKTW